MDDKAFSLHPRLQSDTVVLGDLPLCTALLMNNRNYPWMILVPRRTGIRELHDLCKADQHQLLQESDQVSRLMQRLLEPDKLNVAALGNIVPQFHWHVIARFKNDTAWPAPVWGTGDGQPYLPEALKTMVSRLRAGLFEG